MFYRVEGGEVEDLTGRGLKDLRAGLARTPVEPLQTFTDDPLRVLRSVRFACRFGLLLDKQLAFAATSASVTAALDSKVSRERLGVEVSKMLEGPDPARAVYLLYSLRLWGVVFRMPPLEQIHRGDWINGALITSDVSRFLPAEGIDVAGLHCALLLHRLTLPSAPTMNLVPPRRSLLWWAGILLPCRHIYTRYKKSSTQTLVEYMHRESLKGLSLGEAKEIDLCNNSVEAMIGDVRTYDESNGLDRVSIGLRVRELRELWRPALLIACAVELYGDSSLAAALHAATQTGTVAQGEADGSGDEPEPEDVAPAADLASSFQPEVDTAFNLTGGMRLPAACSLTLQTRDGPAVDFGVNFSQAHHDVMQKYASFSVALETAGLHETWKQKPFFSGKDIMEKLELPRGPIVKVYMDKQLHWQLATPNGTSQECLAHLLEFRARREGGIKRGCGNVEANQ